MNYHELHQMAIDNEYEVMEMAKFHPRAWKLMKKRKNFLVVACDEPYFVEVYKMIRQCERENRRWTFEDERDFIASLDKSGQDAG